MFFPQQTTPPDVFSAQVCQRPALTAVIEESPPAGIAAGVAVDPPFVEEVVEAEEGTGALLVAEPTPTRS